MYRLHRQRLFPLALAVVLLSVVAASAPGGPTGAATDGAAASGTASSGGAAAPLQLPSRSEAAAIVAARYAELARTPGDIVLHLPLLRSLAARCESVAELGVRSVVSSWAFLAGLVDGADAAAADAAAAGVPPPPRQRVLHCLDIVDTPAVLATLAPPAWALDVTVTFTRGDSARVPLPPVDLVFIDTWHTYGHLRRELALHAPRARRFIALHDTECDGAVSEGVRMGWDLSANATGANYTLLEVTLGLKAAVFDFLAAHIGEWALASHAPINNGLTVLARVAPAAAQPA